MSPSAQTTKLLQSNEDQKSQAFQASAVLQMKKGQLGVYFYLFRLMLVSGVRISELLNADHHCISNDGRLLIAGLKGSSDRLIFDSECTVFLLKMKAIQRNPFQGCNRFTARRILLSLSLYTHKSGRKNLTMTGVFREAFAKDVRSIQDNDGLVSKHIGHKNLKNGSFYGKG